jgi:hypothetical protein
MPFVIEPSSLAPSPFPKRHRRAPLIRHKHAPYLSSAIPNVRDSGAKDLAKLGRSCDETRTFYPVVCRRSGTHHNQCASIPTTPYPCLVFASSAVLLVGSHRAACSRFVAPMTHHALHRRCAACVQALSSRVRHAPPPCHLAEGPCAMYSSLASSYKGVCPALRRDSSDRMACQKHSL